MHHLSPWKSLLSYLRSLFGSVVDTGGTLDPDD
jgi:hypothetical protein